MLPKKEFISELNSSPEKARSELENSIEESKTLSLNSTLGSSFTISTRKSLRRLMFGRKILLAEINGEIGKSQIRFRIQLQPLMGAIILIDSLILLLIAYDSFDSGNIEDGSVFLGTAGIILISCYLILKNEITYLEKELRKIKRIKP